MYADARNLNGLFPTVVLRPPQRQPSFHETKRILVTVLFPASASCDTSHAHLIATVPDCWVTEARHFRLQRSCLKLNPSVLQVLPLECVDWNDGKLGPVILTVFLTG